MATGPLSEKRLLLARLAEARDISNGGPRRRALWRTAAVLLILMVLAGLVLWLIGFFSTPKEVLEVRGLVDEQIRQLQKVARNEAPFTYDNAGFRPDWERIREIPQEVRDQVRSEMDRLFRARENAERQSYFAMPPQERQKELDRRIKAQEARRQAWQQQRSNPSAGNGRNGGQGQGSPVVQGTGAGAGQGRGNVGTGVTQAGTAGPRGAGPAGNSEDARNARRKQRLDMTTPEQRAQSTEYRRAMDARRQQLGLSPGRGRGG